MHPHRSKYGRKMDVSSLDCAFLEVVAFVRAGWER